MVEVLIRVILGCLGLVCFWVWKRDWEAIEKYRDDWHKDPANVGISLTMHASPFWLVVGIIFLMFAVLGVS